MPPDPVQAKTAGPLAAASSGQSRHWTAGAASSKFGLAVVEPADPVFWVACPSLVPCRPAWFPGMIVYPAREGLPMPDARFSTEMVGGMPIVTTPADIDVITIDELRGVLLDAGRRGHATVVVDMTRTVFCDSAGLGLLVGAHRRALAKGGELRLVVAAEGAVARVLAVTALDRVIPSFGSLGQALALRA